MSEAAVITLVIILVSAAAAITVRVVIKAKSKNQSNKVAQKGNIVGGDQAGRDINKK